MATKRNTQPREQDSRNLQNGQDGLVKISLDGAAHLDRPDIEIVDGPNAMSIADELAFMEERVCVVVHESTDPNAEDPILVANGGINQWIFRGQETIVKRKFVERLARAKLTNYRQNLAEKDVDKYNRLFMATAVQYPFSVIGDSPRGQDWLRKVLAEA